MKGGLNILDKAARTAVVVYGRSRRLISGVWRDFSENNGPQAAASFSFFCFLSLIALIILSGAVLGMVLKGDPELVENIINYISENVAGLSDTVSEALDASINLRGVLGVTGALGLLYTGTKVVDSLQIWLSTIWGVEKPRYLKRKAKSLFSLLALATAIVLGGGIHVIFALVSDQLRWLRIFTGVFVFILTSLILFFTLSFIYSYAVDAKLTWKRVWRGALFAALLINPMQLLLTWYYSNMGDLSAVYGSFAGIVLAILIIYYTGYIVFLGAELNQYLDKTSWRPDTPKDNNAGGGIKDMDR